MDLNASPVPEEDEETFERHIEEYGAPETEERVESAVDIARRVPFLFLVVTLVLVCFDARMIALQQCQFDTGFSSEDAYMFIAQFGVIKYSVKFL